MDYKLQRNSQNNDMASLVNDVCNIIETGRREAYAAAGKSAVVTFWNIGRRIVEEEQQGERACRIWCRSYQKTCPENSSPIWCEL